MDTFSSWMYHEKNCSKDGSPRNGGIVVVRKLKRWLWWVVAVADVSTHTFLLTTVAAVVYVNVGCFGCRGLFWLVCVVAPAEAVAGNYNNGSHAAVLVIARVVELLPIVEGTVVL